MAKPRRQQDITETLEELRAQMAALARRLERLEAVAASPPNVPKAAEAPPPAPGPAPEAAAAVPAAPAPVTKAPPEAPEISEEEILAVSAALAAYLGVRMRIRSIRLMGSPAWAQQGRVSIQASHRLHS
jgi:methylmalonyl-CoA carboxyltransferase large subunit